MATTTLQTVEKIAKRYDPTDLVGVIHCDATFRAEDGKKVTAEFFIYQHQDGQGPAVLPGAWFLPYGGVWANPIDLCNIKERPYNA